MDAIEKSHTQVVGISYDSVDVLKKFANQSSITFPLLSDGESKTIDAYRVRNQDVKPNSRQDGIPHPGTIVIDEEGVIRAKLFRTVRKRHTLEELISAVRGLGGSSAGDSQ